MDFFGPNRVCYLPPWWRQGPRKRDSRDKELAQRSTTEILLDI